MLQETTTKASELFDYLKENYTTVVNEDLELCEPNEQDNEGTDFCHHGVQVPGVLRQPRAKDREVVKEQVLAVQAADHVVHPLEDCFFAE